MKEQSIAVSTRKADGPNIYTDIDLDKHDMAGVVVARAEREMHTALALCKSNIAEVEKQRETYTKMLSDACNLTANNRYDNAKGLLVSFMRLYPETKFKTTVKVNVGNDSYFAYLQVECGPSSDSLKAAFSTPQIELQYDTQVMRDANNTIKTANEELVRLKDEAVTWKKRLANIGMLERQAKAAITEAELRKSEGGQELLETMLGDLQKQVLSLPSY